MTGIQAINSANGWSMALVGTLIVFSGLIVLSFVISQLHKIISAFEKKATHDMELPIGAVPAPPTFKKWPVIIGEQADLYVPIIEELDSSFQLDELYTKANKRDMPHPHRI